MMGLEMGYTNLTEAVDRFSTAVQYAIKALPQESIVNYLASTDIDLHEVLGVAEQMEQYEFCSVIVKAIQQKQAESSLISAASFVKKASAELN
ncbi:MAG TPA: hypothetical protein VGE26_09455 [Sphingobacteriaceae bacterium]